MSGCVYMFEGLDEWEKELMDVIQTDFPKEFERLVIDVASELHEQVTARTPVDTSNLQTNWKIGKIIKKGRDYYIQVYNNTDYAEHVEYGHRKKHSEEMVPGAHMMEISLAVLEARLPLYLQDWLSVFLDEHF
ncbi:HK97 gp10 family phage protein [[Clostridium] innocuum]|nr:HK97 gp10 family phage protein [[Clostridium] innocuum]